MAQNILAWKCNCKSLEDIDLFSKSPDVYYKKKPQKSSICGRILTISYGVIYAAFFIYKIVRMALKIDVSFYETETWTGEIPSLKLNNHHFYGGFGIIGPTGRPYIDEHIYYPVAHFITLKKPPGSTDFVTVEDRDLGVEPCQLDKFGEEFREFFVGKLDGLYCLKDVDVLIQGHTTLDAYSYFMVYFYPCVNGVNNRNDCYPPEVVKAYLKNTGLAVKMEDIELTPQKYDSPIQVRSRELTAPVMDSLYNNIQAYFHIIDIETDNDIIGFEALSNKKSEKHFKYDVTFMVNSINEEGNLPTDTGGALCNIQLQLTEQMISIHRTYTKLIEVLGDVGGLMEFVFSFFKIISIFTTEALYEKGLINSLFSFDINKKLILFKSQKKGRKNSLANELDIFKPLKPDTSINLETLAKPVNKSFGLKMQIDDNEETLRKKDTLKEENENIKDNKGIEVLRNQHRTRRSRTHKRSSKKAIRYDNEESKSKNLIKDVKDEEVKEKNTNNIDIYSQTKETEQKTNNVIKRNEFTKVDLYLCFLCTRRRKKVENILIDEGMEMFCQKLDVINIFTKLMLMDNFTNSKEEEKSKEMSDECKSKLKLYEIEKKLN